MARTLVDSKYVRDSIQNVQTNEITISEDKLRNKLERQVTCIRESSGTLSYLSAAITCVSVWCSNDFKEIYGITPDMWKMLFIIASFVFTFLFIRSGFHAVFHKVTVDTIVKDIKTVDIVAPDIVIWEKVKCTILSILYSTDSKEEEKKK